MTTTAELTWEQKAIRDFSKNFWSLINVNKQYLQLNEAIDALEAKYGYTARYGDPAYVPYDQRDKGYSKIRLALDMQQDALNDEQTDSLYAVSHVLTILPTKVQTEILKIANAGLDTMNES